MPRVLKGAGALLGEANHPWKSRGSRQRRWNWASGSALWCGVAQPRRLGQWLRTSLHRVAAVAARLVLEAPRRGAPPGERCTAPQPNGGRQVTHQPPALFSGSQSRAYLHPTEAQRTPGDAAGPRKTAADFIPVRKWSAGPVPVRPANRVRTLDFGQEGVGGQLWFGQSLTSPTQDNFDRVSSALRRIAGVYSLLPGHFLGRTVLNPTSS